MRIASVLLLSVALSAGGNVVEVSADGSSASAEAQPPSATTSLASFGVATHDTAPIAGQKPGTSGLRVKTATAIGKHYLQNYVQSVFDALGVSVVRGGTLLVSGDGRYFNDAALRSIVRLAVANGVSHLWVARGALLSTPAASAVVRENRSAFGGAAPFGAFILTASHNPAGPDGDWGIKFNGDDGAPARDGLSAQIVARARSITRFHSADGLTDAVLAAALGADAGTATSFAAEDAASSSSSSSVLLEVIDPVAIHLRLLRTAFDFDAIGALLRRTAADTGRKVLFDAMHGVAGPSCLGLKRALGLGGADDNDALECLNAVPKSDFGGPSSASHGHADPNLSHAVELMRRVGLPVAGDDDGQHQHDGGALPLLGIAADGDGDRNMVTGAATFVTPSDSLAVIAANAAAIPQFRDAGGLKAVARSMPTSRALDVVAEALSIRRFEVPTGWKFFGNLMDSGGARFPRGETLTPLLCGEESFGTGSSLIREKDGMWALLAWLSILAHKNSGSAGAGFSSKLVGVADVMAAHWARFGRHYYVRHDWEGVDAKKAYGMMQRMVGIIDALDLVQKAKKATAEGEKGAPLPEALSPTLSFGGFVLHSADEFSYADPMDGSVTPGQGLRFLFAGGDARVVFRLSGTGVGGATIRVYHELYHTSDFSMSATEATADLAVAARELSQIVNYTGRDAPTVIT